MHILLVMKLTILQEELAKSLNIAARFVSTRSQLPVLSNIVLSAQKTKLYLFATNLEVSITLSLGGKITKEGEIAVPARMITDLVANLKKGPVDFEAEGEILKITTSAFQGSIAGMAAADFPNIPKAISKNAIALPLKSLESALNQVLFSVSGDETRPVLTGVLFMFKDKKLELVSSDGFRLSRKSLKLDTSVEAQKMIVPKNSVSEVVRIPNGETLSLEVKEEDNQVLFGGGYFIAASRVLEGTFPNFENIIPKATATKVLVDKEELLRAVKLASVYAREAANVIKLEAGKGGLTVSAESQKSGNQKTTVEAKVEGKGVEIAYNYRFLEEFLGCIKADEIEIGLNDASAPGVFRDTSDPTYLHLIMPVKLQS